MTKKITLKHPFEFEGKKVETVDFKDRLKGKDLLAAEAEMKAQGIASPTDAERTVYMAARAMGMPVEFVEEMDLADYLVIAARVGDFF